MTAVGPRPVRAERGRVTQATAEELRPRLEREELAWRRVAVQHHGAANRELVERVRSRGAQVIELFGYRWALPEDVGPVLRLLDELREGRLDVTAFSSASQVENLFTVADDAGCGGALAGWLSRRTVTAA